MRITCVTGRIIIYVASLAAFTAMARGQSAAQIDLAGHWQVRLDPEGQLSVDQVRSDESSFVPVTLPGSLRDNQLGDPVGPETQWIGTVRRGVWEQPQYAKYHKADNFKVPFWLQPRLHFVGPAWYRRIVDVPESWRDRRVLLHLERPHWRTTVWVDGQQAGQGESLSTAHEFDLTRWLTPGSHELLVRIHNGMEGLNVGLNSHSVSDHTQTAWHGIVGQMNLTTRPAIAVDDLQVYPASDAKSARVVVQVTNATDSPRQDTLVLQGQQGPDSLGTTSLPISIPCGGTAVECTLNFRVAARRWDEFKPELCRITASLNSDADDSGQQSVTFGVRHVGTRSTRLTLNGRDLFLRGTLECCIFPLTGYPPTDVDSWKRIIAICKAHGLNHIRFHSWCPPKAAFIAADQAGFYYQVECSTWPNVSTALGQQRPIDQWLYREAERILEEYGNHPSFLLLAAGNEPAGPGRGGSFLGPWVDHFKAKTDRQLITSGAGWPSIPENEFHVTPAPRIHQWGQGLNSRINAQPPETVTDYREFVQRYDVPVVSHEIGQWCVYPNFDEMDKYTGTLKPRNFEIFRDLLEQAQMLDQARDFLMASGKLQALCYKEEIESALRTDGFGGFQLLDLHDFPGQGTALVGILDPFWDSKPYISPEEFRRFCNAVVPLARLPKRLLTSDETLVADIEVSNFGPGALQGVTPKWTVLKGEEQVAAGKLATRDIPACHLTSLGQVHLPLTMFTDPAKLTLVVTIDSPAEPHVNSWDVWVYPTAVETAPGGDVVIASELDADAVRYLQEGGKLLLLADPQTVKGEVQIGFSSIFWNTAWTDGQPPHTLGILCDPTHALFGSFPTEFCSNWQWWDLVSRSKPMILDTLPAEARPLVQVVPDWFHPQRLGLIFEARVGRGKLVVCSIDLRNDLPSRPAARQMLHALLKYLDSDDFSPQNRLDVSAIHALFREPTLLQRLGVKVWADSEQVGHEAALAVDGNPDTIWHTQWEPDSPAPPHWIALDLQKPVKLSGIRYLPRGDMSNGRIAAFEVQLSSDGETWNVAAAGSWSDDAGEKVVRLDQPRMTRYVRLVGRREVRGRAWSSIAELDIIVADDE